MRRVSARWAARLVLLVCLPAALVAPAAQAGTSPQQTLNRALNKGMRQAGNYSGAYVLDLTTGQAVYSNHARNARLPASVEKLYTTSTALIKFGSGGTLKTSVLGEGGFRGTTFDGTLYLRGGGDPTFGSGHFDWANYRGGANVTRLVTDLKNSTGIRTFNGTIVADESLFDSLRGTPATGYGPNSEVEGELSALSFNRGWANRTGSVFYRHPAIEAGQQFLAALRAGGVKVHRGTRVVAGKTPRNAKPLTVVHSPKMATLVGLTNAPSDNFFAETLLKDLGAHYGSGGTTPAGVAVVKSTVASSFGLHPRFNDGSGLSRYDRTTPYDVVSLLRQQADNSAFTSSLAVAGESGTLIDEMRGTYAQGRCRGKTGTLHDVSNVVGYCQAQDGDTLAYAFMLNGIDPDYAHPIQDRMEVAVAKYNG